MLFKDRFKVLETTRPQTYIVGARVNGNFMDLDRQRRIDASTSNEKVFIAKSIQSRRESFPSRWM
jgi:hypothetical protein